MVEISEYLKNKAALIDSVIRKYIPEKFDQKYLEWLLGKATYKYSIEALNKSLAEPIWDLLNRGGKRWRPALTLLICEALGGDLEKCLDFVIIPEVIHNGTLIIDDIEDRSELRRGKPCIHKIFGEDIAINAGNMMYFIPMIILLKNKNKYEAATLIKIYETYMQEMINVSCGQATDIAWHNGLINANNISEEEYLQMCAHKTGCLARLAAKLGAILAGANDDVVEKIGKLAEAIGISFQIQDDILSASGSEFQERKGYGDDITEGKKTLLVIYTLSHASEKDKKRLIEILDMHTRDEKLIKEAINIINKYNAIDYAKKFGMKLVQKAWNDVDVLLPESKAKNLLKEFVEFSIQRKI